MHKPPETAVKVFKFVTEDYKSPSRNFRLLDYSGPYPRTVTEPNCDPPEKGQCAKGVHVIPKADNINWENVKISSRIVAGYVLPEHIIFSEDNGKMRVSEFTVTHEPTREEIIPYILQSADTAYAYAKHYDKAPKDDTRMAVCRDALYAYYYARDIDKAPHKDTWQAVKLSSWQNRYHDRFPHFTRQELDDLT